MSLRMVPTRWWRAGVARVGGPVALVLVLAAAPAVAAGQPPGVDTTPQVVISPLPGTPDANPDTQISFLGVPADEIHDIVVTGTLSGRHSGTVASYSTGTGESFLPAQRFKAGEEVRVSATVIAGGAPVHIATHFTVSDPANVKPAPVPQPPPLTSSNVTRFVSLPDVVAPAVHIVTPASDLSSGDIFLTPAPGPAPSGPMIITPSGGLVWFDPLPRGTEAYDLNLQNYENQPVLTWWQGQIFQGHGQGIGVIDNASYQQIATVRAGNGLSEDLHELELTPQGTAWISAYAPVHANLTAQGGAANGTLDDSVVQEIDVKTGLVMFEWHAYGHVPLSASYIAAPRSAGVGYDFFHLNSIQPQSNGEILISSRNTWAAYLVSARTGHVIWSLGGKHSNFRLGPGAHFAWQHDVRLTAPGMISMFDNEDAPALASQSRALELAIDTQTHRASVVAQYDYAHPVLARSEGSVQTLAAGATFVSWGQGGPIAEYASTGALTFAMGITGSYSYRAFRYPWSGQPASVPALVAAPAASAGSTELYASWNGASDVASWTVLAGATPTALASVGSYPSSGFETAISAPTVGPYVAVEAVSAAGTVLATSAVIKV